MDVKYFAEDNIFVDLHIHSKMSEYKDGKIVDNSTKENADVLITALESKNINLFAITDHNRFDYDLYIHLKEKISENDIIKNVLPGIEFDVVLEKGFTPCHIIAIFDDSQQNLLFKIPEKINDVKTLNSKNEFYQLEEFEQILHNIGLKVLLIAHQKQDLNNKEKGNASLSSSCDDPSVFLSTGYIDSLEFSSNKQEGIVINSLRKMDIDIPLITGSDCHEWEAYPFREKNSEKKPRHFTSFRCLPTFKGLVMALTSFSTRANRLKNENPHFIKSICINNKEIPLANGINAIIGDNGSGKTLLMSLLAEKSNNIYKNLIKSNNLKVNQNDSNFQTSFIKYVQQGQINDEVIKGTLFKSDSNYYDDIPTKAEFRNNINNYFDKVYRYVTNNIEIFDQENKLENLNINIEAIEKDFYLPVIDSSLELEEVSSDKERVHFLDTVLKDVETELAENTNYYKSIDSYELMNEVVEKVKSIYINAKNLLSDKQNRNEIKGIIVKTLDGYSKSLENRRTSEEKHKNCIIDKYLNFVNSIVKLIKLKERPNPLPAFPSPINGHSEKQSKGYIFKKTARYHQNDLKDEFYAQCFNKPITSDVFLSSISTKDAFVSALKGITSWEEVSKFKENKVEKFINEYCEEQTFIFEIDSNEGVGNTPGENALVYFKYLINEKSDDFYVLAVDQPEDDINPMRIKSSLIPILNSIRDKKQIIIVTHNPMLVVNLDVDNVLYIKKNNSTLDICCGALEFENNDYSILNHVKQNLDGGYKAIERRLKRYERDSD